MSITSTGMVEIEVESIAGMDAIFYQERRRFLRVEARMTEAQMFAALQDFLRHITAEKFAEWVSRIEAEA